MYKKVISMMLSALILTTVFSGCSNKQPAELPENTSSTAASQAKSGEREKLAFLTNLNVDTEGTDVNDNDYLRYIEERNNVDIEIISDATNNYFQKLNTMMASNELPDMLMLTGPPMRTDLARWASEEMLMPLDDLLKEYPSITSAISETAWSLTKQDGKTYGVPMQRFDPSPFLSFVRKDWMDNLGIDPTSVKTIDDWYNMLKRFTTDDPDQNGQNDTYGLTAQTSGTDFTCSLFLDSFGAARAKVVDGELLPNYILPEYKEWLKFMNKLYEEKILDPEYIVTSGTQLWEKVASNKYGNFLWFWGLQEYQSKNLSRDNLVAMAPPLRQDGSDAKYIYSSPIRHMIALSADCKNPKAAMEVLKWACSEEGSTFIYAGLEGKDYDIKDGKIVAREDRKGKNIAWRYLTAGTQNPNVDQEPFKSILEQSYGALGMEHLALSNEYGAYNELDLLCPSFTELAQYDLNKPVQEFTDKAITGEIDIDVEWDSYVAKWRKAGGDLKIQLSTEWYNNEYNKK